MATSPSLAAPAPLRPESIDTIYSDWLLTIERRAIQPLKWIVLISSTVVWQLSSRWSLPPVHVFMLFFVYFMITICMEWFLRRGRVTLEQARPFAIVSYTCDVVFVSLQFLFDALYRTTEAGAFDVGTRSLMDAGEPHATLGAPSESSILFFLLVLRGFALFRTAAAHMTMGAVISIVFISSLVVQERTFAFVGDRTFILRFLLLWLVIFLAWFLFQTLSRQQEELARARERLVRSEGLARLGEVAAGIAHEINNPIGVISAYAEMLVRQTRPDDPIRGDCETIQKEALRCRTIMQQMLALASPATMVFTEVELRPLLEESFAAGRDSARRDDTADPPAVEWDLPPALPPARACADQLRQVFLNVYRNACEALPTREGRIRTLVRADDNVLEIRITDNGSGIDGATRDRLFEPFFTRKSRGTGLGLAVSRRIIEAHNGAISLEPAGEGRGACAIIRLPAHRAS